VGTDATLLADALDEDETAFKIELPSPSQPQPPRTAPAPNPPTYATTFAASGVSVSSLTLQLTASTTIYDASATVEVPLDADVPSWRSTRSQIIEDAMAGDHVWTSPFKASSSPLIESVPAPTAASFDAPATPPSLPQPQRNDWVVSGGSPSAAADYSPGDFVIVHLPSTLTSYQDDDSSTMQMVDALVSEARAAEITTRPAVWPTQGHADDDAQARLPRHASDSGLLLPPHAHTGIGVDAAAFEHILGDTTGLTAAAEATGSMWSVDPSIPVVFQPMRDKATIEYSDPVASVPMTDGRPAFVALQEPTRCDAPAPTYLPAPTVAQKPFRQYGEISLGPTPPPQAAAAPLPTLAEPLQTLRPNIREGVRDGWDKRRPWRSASPPDDDPTFAAVPDAPASSRALLPVDDGAVGRPAQRFAEASDLGMDPRRVDGFARPVRGYNGEFVRPPNPIAFADAIFDAAPSAEDEASAAYIDPDPYGLEGLPKGSLSEALMDAAAEFDSDLRSIVAGAARFRSVQPYPVVSTTNSPITHHRAAAVAPVPTDAAHRAGQLVRRLAWASAHHPPPMEAEEISRDEETED
jgi:hypothetical protein